MVELSCVTVLVTIEFASLLTENIPMNVHLESIPSLSICALKKSLKEMFTQETW